MPAKSGVACQCARRSFRHLQRPQTVASHASRSLPLYIYCCNGTSIRERAHRLCCDEVPSTQVRVEGVDMSSDLQMEQEVRLRLGFRPAQCYCGRHAIASGCHDLIIGNTGVVGKLFLVNVSAWGACLVGRLNKAQEEFCSVLQLCFFNNGASSNK